MGYSTVTNWGKLRDFWVEKLLPYLRDECGAKACGAVGTGWGSWVATRLSSYGEVLACRNNCPNEKPGGLASSVFNSSPFGKQCVFEELMMMHGFLLEGDRSVEAIAVTAKVTMNRAVDFFNTYLHFHGEPTPISEEELKKKHEEDFDLKAHSSDGCRTCLEIRHQANKASARML